MYCFIVLCRKICLDKMFKFMKGVLEGVVECGMGSVFKLFFFLIVGKMGMVVVFNDDNCYGEKGEK